MSVAAALTRDNAEGPSGPGREYIDVEVKELDTRYSALRLPNPEATAALGRSVKRHGVLHPLTVNRESDGTLVVLDGFKRLSVFAHDPTAVVPVRIVTLSAAQAMAALLTFNRPHKGLTELEEAWVVRALVREHKLRQNEVAELLGRHKSWVCRRLQLAERLEQGVVDDMRLGLVSATVARELVRLPRGNQAQVAEAVEKHGLTSRQTGELVGRLLETDDEESKAELLADPLRYLESAPAPSPRRRDARLSESGDKLKWSLGALGRQATITDRVLRSPSNAPLSSDLDVLGPDLREVIEALRAVLETLVGLSKGVGDNGG
jgi:ParB/RepB/Spo0J family partition protein